MGRNFFIKYVILISVPMDMSILCNIYYSPLFPRILEVNMSHILRPTGQKLGMAHILLPLGYHSVQSNIVYTFHMI